MNQESRIKKKNIFPLFIIFIFFIAFILSLSIISFGFAQTTSDTDNDGLPDSADLCPEIPASNSQSGCPTFTPRPGSNKKNNAAHVQWTGKREDLLIREKTEIKLGDVFWAIIHNPETEEVFSESNKKEVRN